MSPWGYDTALPMDSVSYGAMYPRTFMTRWGGDTQYNIFPNRISPDSAYMMQGMGEPGHISQWNPGLFGMTSPLDMQNDQSKMQAMTGLALVEQEAMRDGRSCAISCGLNANEGQLQKLKESLQTLSKNDKLTKEQKKAVLELLKYVCDTQLDCINIRKASVQGADIDQVSDAAIAVIDSTKALVEEAKNLAAAIEAGAGTEPGTEEEPAPGTTDPSDPEKPAPGKPLEEPEKSYIRDLSVKFNNAINYLPGGIGTDDDAFKAVINDLDLNNIIAVMQYYAKNFGNGDKDAFIKDFMGDAGHFQKQELGGKILQVLIDRAEHAEIGDKIDAEVVAIRQALNKWWIPDDEVIKNFSEICNKIVEAESKAKAEPKKSEDEKPQAETKPGTEKPADEKSKAETKPGTEKSADEKPKTEEEKKAQEKKEAEEIQKKVEEELKRKQNEPNT